MTDVFDLGQVARCQAVIDQIDGVTPVDPATVAITVEQPDGTEDTKTYPTDPEVVHPSTGVFYRDWPTAQVGTHFYRYVTTSPQGAGDGFFVVEAPLVAV